MQKFNPIFILMVCISVTFSCSDENTNQDIINEYIDSSPIADYELLFIGNSHSAAHGLPDIIVTLIDKGLLDKTVNAKLAPGYLFLDERINDGITHGILVGRKWSHVILQAQKYSTTGNYYYSTDAAEEWVRRVSAQDANPILFPEWPRRGNTEEGARIHNLHRYIAAQEPACVAPIGLAWEESLFRYPAISLHAPDGNHSNIQGALLTAYVLYQVITGQAAIELPYIEELYVNDGIQQKLKEVATYTVDAHLYCP